MNAARITAGDSATSRAVHLREGPARYAVASTAATVQSVSRITVTSKNSRPLMNTSLIGLTTQAAACIAAPMMTGYSTGWPR